MYGAGGVVGHASQHSMANDADQSSNGVNLLSYA